MPYPRWLTDKLQGSTQGYKDKRCLIFIARTTALLSFAIKPRALDDISTMINLCVSDDKRSVSSNLFDKFRVNSVEVNDWLSRLRAISLARFNPSAQQLQVPPIFHLFTATRSKFKLPSILRCFSQVWFTMLKFFFLLNGSRVMHLCKTSAHSNCWARCRANLWQQKH